MLMWKRFTSQLYKLYLNWELLKLMEDTQNAKMIYARMETVL